MPRYRDIYAIKSGDAVLQTVISHNFSGAEVILQNLDSANYGGSSIESEHVANNAILSQHLSEGGLGSAEISSAAIKQIHLAYKQTDAGVQVVFVGSAPPANMIGAARFSHTLAIDSASVATYNYTFTAAEEGDPGFTAAPQMGMPAVLVAATTDFGPQEVRITAIDSVSADVSFVWSATAVQNMTVNVNFKGNL
jgi:hypothetical protein